jgi:hypothetical protein
MRHGVAYDLCLVIPEEELEQCLLSMPGWEELINSHGYIRHRLPDMPPEVKELPASQDPKTGQWFKGDRGIRRYKVPPEQHLEPTVGFEDRSAVHGLNLVDEHGRPTRRLILIGNRNLGNNPGFVAWHSEKSPQLFHLKGENVRDRTFTMLTSWKDGDLSIEPITFGLVGDSYKPLLPPGHPRKREDILWCTFGQQVLRKGKIVPIEEIIDQFYDIRHVLWFPLHPIGSGRCSAAEQEFMAIYENYPKTFRDNLLRELRAGRPRSRYLHNAVGIASDRIIILQRHGTPEEIGQWLREEGAEDGLILDNGGSVFTWAWWAFRDVISVGGKDIVRTGNVIFSAPDWRPPTISLIAFVLWGPVWHVEPSGTIAMAMV